MRLITRSDFDGLACGALLLKAGDFVFISGYRVFNQSFGIQATGKARDDISSSVNTAGAAAC